jgi:hypothetical protein
VQQPQATNFKLKTHGRDDPPDSYILLSMDVLRYGGWFGIATISYGMVEKEE